MSHSILIKFIFLGLWISACFIPGSFAQTKPSYEDRLSQVGSKASDQHLGTLSGRDKSEMRKKELFDAYTYAPSNALSAVDDKAFEGDYVEFRKEHKIPNYIGDDVAKQALKKAKDDTQKTEVVKIVEAEKLLQDTFKAYHEEKVKTELESDLLKTMGTKQDKGLDTQTKEMDERIDIVGDKTANILNTSIQKLAASNLIETKDANREVYMASGGRVFPKLSLEEDKDFLNVRGHVMDRVQKELMTALSSAINEFYHVEQKETSKAEIEKKEQLLAFVKVEDKAQSRNDSKVERMQAIQEFMNDLEKKSGLSAERISEIKQNYAEFLNTLTPEERVMVQKNYRAPFQEALTGSKEPRSGANEKSDPVFAPKGAFYGDQGHVRINVNPNDPTVGADGPVVAPSGAYDSSGRPMSNPNEAQGPVSAPSGAHDSNGNPM